MFEVLLVPVVIGLICLLMAVGDSRNEKAREDYVRSQNEERD